jgi:hypothetical protein
MTDEYIIDVNGEWIGKYVKVDSQRVYVVKHYKSLAKAKNALWGIIDRTFKTPSVFRIYKCWGDKPNLILSTELKGWNFHKCWGDKPDEKRAVYLCRTSKINDYQYSVIIYP